MLGWVLQNNLYKLPQSILFLSNIHIQIYRYIKMSTNCGQFVSNHATKSCIHFYSRNLPQKRSLEKSQKRHDNVMRVLVRRFVTAEQRKRDDFGITEDDVMEIRQDISSLRYEIIDILHTNGMKTPVMDPTDFSCTFFCI